MRRGWFKESYRHYLASKGVSTTRYVKPRYMMAKVYPEKVRAPAVVKDALAPILMGAGAKGVYVVGGYVRDQLMGVEPHDFDVEVHGITMEQIAEALRAKGIPVSEVGKRFGILVARVNGESVEIGVPRVDASGRQPEVQLLTGAEVTPADAARRRELTMNAIMYDVVNDKIVDPYGGVRDIEADIIRMVDPANYSDDPLRAVRAARFAARTGFAIEPETIAAASKADVKLMEQQRFGQELKKALESSPKPSVFFRELDRMGQLKDSYPEIAALKGVPQRGDYHPEGDVFEHTMQVLDRTKEMTNDRSLLLAALLHDVGKVKTTTVSPEGKIQSIGHEEESVKVVTPFLRRLALSEAEAPEVKALIAQHMRPHAFVREKEKPGLRQVNKLLVGLAGSPENLMRDPEGSIARYRKSLLLARADKGPSRADEYKVLEEALPPVEHYVRAKPDTKALLEQGVKGPALGKLIREKYVSKIGQRQNPEKDNK